MKYKETVLIFNTPALNTDIQTYSLEELLDLHIKVIVLDASPILSPNANKIVTATRLSDTRFETHICNTKMELELHIKQNAKTACFIPMFQYHYEAKLVFKLFTKYDVYYGHVTTARTELELGPSNVKYKKTWKNSKLNPAHLYKAFFNRIGKKVFKYKNASFIVIGGKNNSDLYINACIHNDKTKILYLHTWDYERFLNSETYDNEGKPYCVYLDTYFPFHPDIKTEIGFKFTQEDKKNFVNDMNKVFNYIKENYNLKVIIAAHPRANYKDKVDIYPNVKIEYGKTSQLVKGASLVIGNVSNSNLFAVMADKPLVLINSYIIKKCDFIETVLLEFANLTGANVVEKATELPKNQLPKINYEKYNLCKNEYFESGDCNKKNMWSSIIDIWS